MGINFSAFEILQIAKQIEENAFAYYLKASEITKDMASAKTFLTLAEMEKGHKETFEKMAQDIKSNNSFSVYDPFNEAELYLKTVADLHGGEGALKEIKLSGSESFKEIIDVAIELEKKSILFYLGLKGFVAEKEDLEKVMLIIDEEKKHLVQLAKLRMNSI